MSAHEYMRESISTQLKKERDRERQRDRERENVNLYTLLE